MKRSSLILLPLAALGLVIGWAIFRFTCDDAYIAFRYVAMRHEGWGTTWNLPPFPPVEGYTSFLWVWLLDAIWTLTGANPTQSADWLSLACSAGTLALLLRALDRMELPEEWQPHRLALSALTVGGVLANRTFLAWTSSGLETALWELGLVAWTLAALGQRWSALGWLGALLALTRPDGMLFLAFSAPVLLWRRSWVGLAALLPVGAHLLWRHATYGLWVPNTFYAKVGEPWPEAGLRHLASFVLEYSFFLWIAPAIVLLREPKRSWLLPLGALGAHAAYYVLKVGGDHFEHRIFVHFVPLAWLLAAGAAGKLRPAQGLVGMAVGLAFSLPIPWTHHRLTRDFFTREQTHVLVEPVAPALPWLPWAGAFDDLQRWMILRHIGMRHQEHKVLGALQTLRYASREDTLSGAGVVLAREVPGGVEVLPAADPRPEMARFPVIDLGTAGAGWFLGEMSLVDILGLNDPIVARQGHRHATRIMAHEVDPPPGYIECLRPNLFAGLVVRDPTGRTITAITPSADYWRALDVRNPVLPLPQNLAGREDLRASPAWILVVRDPPMEEAAVRACTTRSWESPPGGAESRDSFPQIEALEAASRAARRRAIDSPSPTR